MPSDLQTPEKDCAKSGGEHETLRRPLRPPGLMLVHQIHALGDECVCNYSLRGGCFLVSAPSEEKELLLYNGSHAVHSPD